MITLLNKFDDDYILEKKDVYDIGSSYIKENKIEPYLRDIVFTNDEDVVAHYNITTSKIMFNHDRIMASCKNLFNGIQNLYQIDDKYTTYFLNFYYLYVIYHEFEHVKQKSKYENEDNYLYSYLYELFIILVNNDKSLYKKHHDIFPMEIEANNIGLLTAYNLMNHTKLPTKEAKVMYLQYLFSLASNYQKQGDFQVSTPIELLRQKTNLVDIGLINVLLKEYHLSKIDRMNLGLFITSREYDSVDHEKYKNLLKVL